MIKYYLFVGKVDLTGQFGQPVEVEKILKGLLKSMSRGFFIECGAFDGVSLSNILHFEPSFFRELQQPVHDIEVAILAG